MSDDEHSLHGSKMDRTAVYCSAAVIHAAAILGTWIAEFKFELPILNAKIWTLFAWAWVGWLFVLVPRISGTQKLVIAALVLSFALLSPTATTVYSFTAWLLGGFGP